MTVKDVFAQAGGVFLFITIMFLAICAVSGIRELIDTLKHRYRYKHRFDKPPTAKCYCIDCIRHDRETGRCWRFGETTGEYRRTADNWFCWEAEPRRKEDA